MIQFILFSLVCIAFMAVAEYLIHKYTMHRRFFKWKRLSWVFEDHHIEHHKHSRFDFNVDLPIHFHLIISSPILILLYFIYPVGLIPYLVVMAYHSIYWTKLHRAVHDLESNWTQRLPNFEKMKNHHLLHHKNPSKNFGVVFPITDKIFGTAI